MNSTSQAYDPAVTDFRQKLFEYVDELAPDLNLEPFESDEMKKRGITWFRRVQESEWIKFTKALDANPYSTLYLKPKYGSKAPCAQACLEIKSDKAKHDYIKSNLTNILKEDMNMIDAKCSISVNISSPALYATKPFEDQLNAVDQSIASLRQLQSWYLINKSYIADILNSKAIITNIPATDASLFVPSHDDVLKACKEVEIKNLKYVFDLIRIKHAEKSFHPDWRTIVEKEIMPSLISETNE